jgi:hypothetical protein
MTREQPEKKSGLPQEDRKLVGGIFGFYFICTCSVLGLLGWWVVRREVTANANATATGAALASTSAAIASQESNATATAVARTEEQNQYEFVERFDEVSGRWYVGLYRNRGDMTYSIKNGVYAWDVSAAKGYSFSSGFYKGNDIKDFDVFMDIQFVDSESREFLCSGLAFRKSEADWEGGAYVFNICKDSRFNVEYYDKNGWKPIVNSGYSSIIYLEDWNRIEIEARGNHFIFTINHVQVFETIDSRLKQGSLAIFLTVPEGETAEVWFDNFGFQSR